MESASRWPASRITASAQRVITAPCVTSRGSCSTPAAAWPASMAAARSRTRETPTVTVRVATPESSATQVGLDLGFG